MRKYEKTEFFSLRFPFAFLCGPPSLCVSVLKCRVQPRTMPPFTIRQAEPADVPLVLALISELATFERLAHEAVGTEDLLAQHLFGSRPAAEVLLAFSGDAPAGFALFFQNFSTFLARPGIYLEDLFVRPEFRGTGIGRALLQRVAHLALERGCGRFEWAVLDWNENAIGFYKKLGAQVMEDWRICRVTGPALERLGAPSPEAAA